MKWTRLRDGDLSVKKFKKMKEGDPSAWGKASAVVHTTAEQILAFVWLYCSNLRMKEHQKKDGNLLQEVYKPITTDIATVPSAQHRTQHIVVQKPMPPPFRPRETNVRYVWGEINNNNNSNNKHPKTLIMAFEPAEINFISEKMRRRKTVKKMANLNTRNSNSSVHPTNDGEEEQNLGVAQLETRGLWVITQMAQNVCEVTFVVNFVDKGKIPTSLVNANIGRALDALSFLKVFYERNGPVVDVEVSLRSARNSYSHLQSTTKQTHSIRIRLAHSLPPAPLKMRTTSLGAAASRVRQERSQNGEFNHCRAAIIRPAANGFDRLQGRQRVGEAGKGLEHLRQTVEEAQQG